jgi:hypothetical protein
VVWVTGGTKYRNDRTIVKANHLLTMAGGMITMLIRTKNDNKIKLWQVYVTAATQYTQCELS